ncbi:OmpW/AlkL family protein [Montanilutibacter psychrotolerans]|uniref:OmpW family protein n=1 Tax=Montanilutibacter psychrotolerans TaxID=1327343 RepID=A0A3M8STK3_9GAMM|nr:OmpW family outer membrane protein [Lysobacter psychrotolerans]RNF82200.1 OmpW family protein [Lysobacter psychrotolerans]
MNPIATVTPSTSHLFPALRTTSIALAGALVLLPAAALAQDVGPTDTSAAPTEQPTTESASGKRFAVVGGYALAEPTRNPQIDGSRVQADGDGVATLSASYYVTDNIAVEAWGAADKLGHRVNTANGKAGSVNSQPYAVSGQYHFRDADSTVRPFVGLGYYESNYDNENAAPTGDLAGRRIGVETAKGAMATAGVDLNFTPTWFARADMRYLHGGSDVKLDGANVGEAKLEPVMLGVGIGARF